MMRTNDLAAFPPGFVISHGHNVHTLQQTQVRSRELIQNEMMISFVLFTALRFTIIPGVTCVLYLIAEGQGGESNTRTTQILSAKGF